MNARWLSWVLLALLCPTAGWGFGRLEPTNLTVQGALNTCSATNTGNTYSCALDPALPSYVSLASYTFVPGNANTGSATINFGPSALTLKKRAGGSLVDLVAGDLEAGAPTTCFYTGTYCVVTTPTGSLVRSVSNSDGSLTISPTTGAVVASINVGHTNVWTIKQIVNFNSVGPSSPPTDSEAVGSTGTLFQLIGGDSANTALTWNSFAGSSSLIGVLAGSTMASPSAAASNFPILSLIGQGHDGNAYSGNQAALRLKTLNAWSNTDHSTVITFVTTPSSSTTMAQAAQVASGLSVGTTTDKGAGTLHANVGLYTAGKITAVMVTGTQQAVGDASDTLRLRSSLATPGSLSNGDAWVDCVGTTPTRQCTVSVRDGGVTYSQNVGAAH